MAEEWQIEAVRAEIGDEESSGLDDGAVEDLIDGLGSVEAAAARVLKQRLANLLAGPASYSISGEISESYTDVIKALQDKVTAYESVVSGAEEMSTVTAYRADRCGR